MASKSFGEAAATKKAVILTRPESNQVVLKEVVDFLQARGYEPEVMDSTHENIRAAVDKIKIGARESSVCYIGGSSKGNDPELVEKTREMIRAVSLAGFNTVCPGSEGMMGVIVEEVKKLGLPVTSVFSLAVAQAFIEKLEDKFDRIIVAPDEDVRQELYHMLSGVEIGLGGGSGTIAEGPAHTYKHTQIQSYKRDTEFGPENYPSPMIYFSPVTKGTAERTKRNICRIEYPSHPEFQKLIMEGPNPEGGFWSALEAMYDMSVGEGFTSAELKAAFIDRCTTKEQVLEKLEAWRDPEVRKVMVMLMNKHSPVGKKIRTIMDGYRYNL